MIKADLIKMLNKSRARFRYLLGERDRKIKNLETEIRQIKKDVKRFGKIVERFPREK